MDRGGAATPGTAPPPRRHGPGESGMLRWLRTSRGQALIEFAFVAPLVLVFLLAIVDFGIALDRRILLDHAVREGARFASVGGNSLESGTPDDLITQIKEYTAEQAQGIVDVGDIEVCYDEANASGTLGDAGDNVQVRVHYRHDFVTGFTSMFDTDLAGIDMNPTSSARVERAADDPEPCGDGPSS